MNENVINLKNANTQRPKTDKYFVYLGKENQYGEILEKEAVGIAFQREGTSAFRLKLWMFHKTPYVIVPVKDDRTKYIVYSVEDSVGNAKGFWNKVGRANLCGNYLKVKLSLLSEDLFLSLFPSKQPNQNNKEVVNE